MTICALLFRDSFPIAITDNLISNKSGIKDLSTPLIENENREIAILIHIHQDNTNF